MLTIVKQTIDFYLQKMREPQVSEININETGLLNSR
jgi:hypothetical protein